MRARRAAETVRRAASKTNVEIMLVLVRNRSKGPVVHLELDNSSKAKNLSALWIIFPLQVLNSAHLI